MLGTFKIDRSNFGHALEAFIIAIVIAAVCVVATGLGWLAYTPAEGFLLGSGLALAWYIGREKRDCETGLDLPAGSPKAWLLMWIRWKNLLDLVGPILVHAIAWAIYLDLFPST
ncbi:hypothetical protein [Shinella sp.]|jgi:hypothetical protein|uniref:hypothetical protein n=1 Tax=Shinella sp. TaxID=1870904 RepID=UPI003F725D7C